jgi:hypothetical protein
MSQYQNLLTAVMQSISVLLTALSCRTYFESLFPSSLTCVKKLVTWLRFMAPTDDVAKRASGVVKSIVDMPAKQGPSFWTDVTALFQDDEER